MLRLLLEVWDLRWLVPTTAILAPAPAYYSTALALRLLKPLLSRRRLAALDDGLYASYQSLVLAIFESFSGVEIRIGGAELAEAESCLLLANHQSNMDWALINSLAIRHASLGHLRYVLKASLQYLPLYGWYFWAHGCVYVRRQGDFRAGRTLAQLAHVREVPASTWLVLFPEGTRYRANSKALAGSQAYAASKGLPRLRRLLFPRVKGAALVLSELSASLRAVYDVTIAYSQRPAPSMFAFATAPAGTSVSVNVRRWPIEEVPVGDEAALERWLGERWAEKEDMLAAYETGQDLPSVQALPSVDWRVTLGNAALWYCLSAPLYLSRPGRQLLALILGPLALANVLYIKAVKAI